MKSLAVAPPASFDQTGFVFGLTHSGNLLHIRSHPSYSLIRRESVSFSSIKIKKPEIGD